LPPEDPFWAAKDMKFTSQRINAGENVKADKAIKV
jgi:hypothetical protein